MSTNVFVGGDRKAFENIISYLSLGLSRLILLEIPPVGLSFLDSLDLKCL